jgi:hypothetical protein
MLKVIICFLGVITTVSLLISFFYILKKGYLYNKIKLEQIKLVKLITMEGVNHNLMFLIERNRIYYMAYICYTVLTILINGLSILYSISTFIFVLSDSQYELTLFSTMISLIAMVLVIINIYFKPSLRTNQYLNGWRKLDEKLHGIFVKIKEDIETNVLSEIEENTKDSMALYYEMEKTITVEDI